MEVDKFISDQLQMIRDDFELSQIKDNVFRYVFTQGVTNLQINALIFRCMDLYSEIITKARDNYLL